MLELSRQFAYEIFVTKPAFFGHANFTSPAETCISSAETHSASLKTNPVPCLTKTDSGSFVTGFRIGAIPMLT